VLTPWASPSRPFYLLQVEECTPESCAELVLVAQTVTPGLDDANLVVQSFDETEGDLVGRKVGAVSPVEDLNTENAKFAESTGEELRGLSVLRVRVFPFGL